MTLDTSSTNYARVLSSPKEREIFEIIARAGDWISTRELCEQLGQRRLTGSDQRLLKRLYAHELVAYTQTRAYLVDGTLNYITRAEARQMRRQQQRINQYMLTSRGRIVWRALAAERRAAEDREIKAAEAARRAELGTVGAWIDDTLYTIGVLWRTFKP